MKNWKLPMAFNGCTCDCHTMPMLHMMACCRPDTVSELIDEMSRRQFEAELLEPATLINMILLESAADRTLAKLVAMTDDELIQCLDECEDGAVAYALDGMVMHLTQT